MKLHFTLLILVMTCGCQTVPLDKPPAKSAVIISGDTIDLGSMFEQVQVVHVEDVLDSFRFNSRGDRIYYTSIESQTFGMIDAQGRGEAIHVSCRPSGFEVDRRETEAYVLCPSPDGLGFLLKISLTTKAVTRSLLLDKGFISFSLALTSDGKTLYMADANSMFVYMLDSNNLEIKRKVALQASAGWRCALSPDDKRLYVLHPFSQAISILGTDDNTLLGFVTNIGKFPTTFVASQDGAKLYIADNNTAVVTVFDTTTFQTSSFVVEDKGKWFSQQKTDLGNVLAMPDLATTFDRKLFMWHPSLSHLAMVDLRSSSVLRLVPPDKMTISGMALDTSGRAMAINGMDRGVMFFMKKERSLTQ